MRGVKPPIIWGDVTRLNPITVKWSSYAQSRTDKPVKGMLTGPVTILNWSFPREDISIKGFSLQIALAIKDEVLDLEAARREDHQIDEAALHENCHFVVVTGMKITLTGRFQPSVWYTQLSHQTQIHTHMCYSEFTDIIPAIDNLDATLSHLRLAVQTPLKSWMS